jgi:hypothetical protein
MGETTAEVKRSVEKLRTSEALADDRVVVRPLVHGRPHDRA